MTNIDTIRAEFERTNARDHRREPPKGNNYIDPMAQADWPSTVIRTLSDWYS